MTNLYSSTGTINYTIPHKVYVDVDAEIVHLIIALMPKSIRLQLPRYKPHITVVRNEFVPNMIFWNKYNGKDIEFEYDPFVYYDNTYCWIRAFCPFLTHLRLELGLSKSSNFTRAPDGFESFHITIGNFKN